MAKPIDLPEWATGGSAAVVEPSLGQKQTGWLADDQPPAGWFNWWMELVYDWVNWIDGKMVDGSTGDRIGFHGVDTTATDANGIGMVAEGLGTGAGVKALAAGATGTPASRGGLYAKGGSPGGYGVEALGVGTSSGVKTTGGDSAGSGITATGGASAGKGASITGGSNSGGSAGVGALVIGGDSTGSNGNGGDGIEVYGGNPHGTGDGGNAITAFGNDVGHGIEARGGPSSGAAGVKGIAGYSAGNGVYGTTSNGAGVFGEATASGGDGVYGTTSYGTGVFGEATASGVAVRATALNGYGIIAASDETSPTRAALRMIPQDADPTESARGDLIVTDTGHASGAGLLRIYDGVSWTTVGTQT